MTVHPCRVCDRESLPMKDRFEANLHLCHDHDLLVRGAVEESARLGKNGFGTPRLRRSCPRHLRQV